MWRRRREASWRLPVLASGRSDPWHYDECPLTAHQIDAAAAAAAHLLALDLTPILPMPMLRAMWRSGHHRTVDRVRGNYGLAS